MNNENRDRETGRYAPGEWVSSGPSRKLKKLYRELANLGAAMDIIRASNPVPDHAPSSYQIKRRQLAPLYAQYYDLLARIDRVQNRD